MKQSSNSSMMQLPYTVVINLPHREDRRRDTEAMLVKTGFPPAAFFPAVRPETAEPFGSRGEHGCFLSHRAVLESPLAVGGVFILEDDASIQTDHEGLRALFSSLPEDWDIFYVGHMQLPENKTTWASNGIVSVAKEIEFIGSHCYMVNASAVDRLRHALDVFLARPRGHPEGGPMPYDGALNVARRQLGLVTYAAIPSLASQRSSRTDVGPLKWFDRYPLIMRVVETLRRLKNSAAKDRS
jgi:GR25 family glycosyltransferase involved in LPS biosynthesis